MSHDYDGQDALGLTIGAYIAGKGYWVTPQVPDDNNDRDAATMALGIEGVADRTVWIAWRMVNGLEGGTYGGAITWTGATVFSGGFTVSGAASFTNAAVVTFANALTVSAGTTTLVALQVNGAATLSGGLVLPAGSTTQIAEHVIFTGDAGYQVLRSVAGSTSSVTIDPWKQDLWECPILSGARTWTLNHPPGNACVETTVVYDNPSAFDLTLSDGGSFAVLGIGKLKSVALIYAPTAGKWLVKASHS